MRLRMVAIPIALFVFLLVGGCVTPMAAACPVCEGEGDFLVDEGAPEEITSNATATVGDDGRVEWTVVTDVDLEGDQRLADADAIERRATSRLREAYGEGNVASVTARIEGQQRVVLTYVIYGSATTAPGDVVVFEQFSTDEPVDATVVNAERLTLRGPGDTVYSSDSAAVVERDGDLQYDRGDRIETDTLVLFGMDEGIRGSLQLRSALVDYHQQRVPIAAVALLLPVLAIVGTIRYVARWIDGPILAGAFEDATTKIAIAVAVAAYLAVVGTRSGIAPVAGVTTALVVGLSLLAVATYAGARSPRRLVPLAFGGTIATTAAIGAVLGAFGVGTGSGSSAAIVTPGTIATPASIGFERGVWAAVVGAPLALGAASDLDRRPSARGLAGTGAVIYAVLLFWWWPIVAPLSPGSFGVTGLFFVVAGGIVTVAAYGTGYAFATVGDGADDDGADGGGTNDDGADGDGANDDRADVDDSHGTTDGVDGEAGDADGASGDVGGADEGVGGSNDGTDDANDDAPASRSP